MRTIGIAVAVYVLVSVLAMPRELLADLISDLEGTVGHVTPERSADSTTADDLEGSTSTADELEGGAPGVRA